MRTNRIVTRVACLTVSLLITSCVPFHQTTTLSSTEFFDRAESGKQRSFADAYLYGEAVKDNYARLKRRQENFRRDSAVAIIAAGATTLFYTVTGGASRDVLTGTAIGGAGLYLTADVLTDRLEQEVFQLGYEGVNCVLSDYARLYDADAALAYFAGSQDGGSGALDVAAASFREAVIPTAKQGKSTEVANLADSVINKTIGETRAAIFKARASLALNSTAIVNRVDGIQNQVEEQRGKIGTDPLTAARNPFQLILNRANQFSGTPITIPDAPDVTSIKQQIKQNYNDNSGLLQSSSTDVPNDVLGHYIALTKTEEQARAVLAALKATIDEGPGETACNIPDQSGQLVLKTAPAALTVPTASTTYQIVITDPRIQAVQASWTGKAPANIKVASLSGGHEQPAIVKITVEAGATAGTYQLYIVDVSGRFATTVDITVTATP